MDRELKFRIWDKRGKFIIDENSDDVITNYYCGKNESCELTLSEILKIFEDKDYEFMQFTGRQDINKRDIYEGDYLAKYSENRMDLEVVKVYWNKLMTSFYVEPITSNIFSRNLILGAFLTSGMDKETKYEIVGNIYENKKDAYLEKYDNLVKDRAEQCKKGKMIQCNSVEEMFEVMDKYKNK